MFCTRETALWQPQGLAAIQSEVEIPQSVQYSNSCPNHPKTARFPRAILRLFNEQKTDEGITPSQPLRSDRQVWRDFARNPFLRNHE